MWRSCYISEASGYISLASGKAGSIVFLLGDVDNESYVQIFIASLLSAFLYSLIYLVLRGSLKIKGGIRLTLDPNARWDGNTESYQRFIARVAKSMLWYEVIAI